MRETPAIAWWYFEPDQESVLRDWSEYLLTDGGKPRRNLKQFIMRDIACRNTQVVVWQDRTVWVCWPRPNQQAQLVWTRYKTVQQCLMALALRGVDIPEDGPWAKM